MNVALSTSRPPAFAALRQLMRPRPPAERCELCAAVLAERHDHLIEPATRKLMCACGPCALLFSERNDGRFKRVPRDTFEMPHLDLPDELWEQLSVPINLAFFFKSSIDERVIAMYPSPAGPTESGLHLPAWRDVVARNPQLADMQSDTQALLAFRVGDARDHFIAPIDECYKLVGLIRIKWRGLSGGADVWRSVAAFIADLKQRSRTLEPLRDNTHA